MNRYYDPDVIMFLPAVILAALVYRFLPAPLSNIVGVILIWSPLVLLQIVFENYLLAIICVVLGLIVLKDCWND
jgi:predicted membrane protein|tara:strand:+ start:71 stop:292 length:222 start_codon:yes stop_codon:yes gene_type:complete